MQEEVQQIQDAVKDHDRLFLEHTWQIERKQKRTSLLHLVKGIHEHVSKIKEVVEDRDRQIHEVTCHIERKQKITFDKFEQMDTRIYTTNARSCGGL